MKCVVAGHREVAVAALAAAAEAGQVGREAAGALEERDPVVAARRDAVQVEHGRAPAAVGAGALRQKTGWPSSSLGVLRDRGHGRRALYRRPAERAPPGRALGSPRCGSRGSAAA